MKNKELIQFFDDQIDWIIEYYNNNDDYINGYDYILYDIAENDDKLDKNKEYSIERGGVFYIDGSVAALNIDEIEVQISGISQNGHNDYFNYLTKGLTEADIKSAFKESKAYHEACLSGNCLYYRPNFETIQLIEKGA